MELKQSSVTISKGGLGRETGGTFRREETWVHLWLILVDVWHKTIKFCKAIILQLKKIKWQKILKTGSLLIELQTSAFGRLLLLCNLCSNTLLNKTWLASLQCTLGSGIHKISCCRLSVSSSNSSIHSCSHTTLTNGLVCPVSPRVGYLQRDSSKV